jgi:membrane protease YdiL (CAAX protease family)
MEDRIDSMEPGGRSLPPVRMAILLFLLIVYPLLSVLFNMMEMGDPADIESRILDVYLPTLAIQISLLAAVLLALRKGGGSLADIGLGKADISFSNFISGLIFFAGAFTLMIIIKTSLARSGFLPDKDIAYILPVTLDEKILWAFLSVSAALFEEIAFRGLVISELKRISGSYWIGALAGSLAFSLGHLYQGIGGVFLTFVYGILFSGLFIARQSVFPCIVAHFLQDFIILFVVFNIGLVE